MMVAATRQDLQSALERTRNSIIGTMFSRNDARTVAAQLRSGISQELHDLRSGNQQFIHQSQAQYEQISTRLSNLEHRLHILQQTLTRYLEAQARSANQYH